MNARLAALLLASFLFLAGCVVQSIRPFATAASRVPMPEGIAGEWLLASEHGTARDGYAPWAFAEGRLDLVDQHGNRAYLETTFFRLDERLFLDSVPGSPDDDQTNRFWNWHIAPMHLPCRVELTDDTLTLLPLDAGWLNKLADAEGGPSYILPDETEKDWRIYTASTEEWEAILRRHAANPEAFPAKLAIVLRRATPPPPPPLPLPGETPGE
jgi:hypothetical protein